MYVRGVGILIPIRRIDVLYCTAIYMRTRAGSLSLCPFVPYLSGGTTSFIHVPSYPYRLPRTGDTLYTAEYVRHRDICGQEMRLARVPERNGNEYIPPGLRMARGSHSVAPGPRPSLAHAVPYLGW